MIPSIEQKETEYAGFTSLRGWLHDIDPYTNCSSTGKELKAQVYFRVQQDALERTTKVCSEDRGP